MKKITFIIALLFCYVGNIIAQQFVSTEPSLKKVVIEEFTGIACSACPSAHIKANELMNNNPGQVFLINIHEWFAPDEYPNFKTEDGRIIHGALHGFGTPSGRVNRSTNFEPSPGHWEAAVYSITRETAPCNIAGHVIIDEASRTATITVEVYYTQDSDAETNLLTIAMTQDSVWGPQVNGEDNPQQYLNGKYCHMHTLRDIITPTWGDEISPTKEGTLITKTYTYQIPEIIGDPNGVTVNLNHIDFIAFVSNSYFETASLPILNVCDMPILIGTQETIFPYFENIDMKQNSFCLNNMTFSIDMMNRGLDELTSVKMLMEIDNGESFEYEWNGSIASYDFEKIEFEMEVPIGIHTVDFKIVEANGTPFNYSMEYETICDEWKVAYVDDENDEIVIELMQDKFGNETRWQITTDDNTVVASGGPYEYFFGQSVATELHEIPLQLPLNQCLKFTITDDIGNGICCNYGEGYYKIIDGHGNTIVDGEGDFGSEVSHIFSIEVGDEVNEIKQDMCEIYPNPARDFIKLSAISNKLSVVRIYNCLGILMEEIEIDSNEIEINVSDYNPGIYFFNIHDNDGNAATEKVSIIDN